MSSFAFEGTSFEQFSSGFVNGVIKRKHFKILTMFELDSKSNYEIDLEPSLR